MKRFLLYYHTIKHLKLKQILFQLKYRLIKYKIKPYRGSGVKRRDLNLFFPVRGKPGWDPEYNVSFLNQTIKVNPAEDWNVNASALWLYNLHYFDDLNVSESTDCISFYSKLIDDWITSNSHQSSSIAMDAYPTSLRLVNWCKFIWRFNLTNEHWNRSIYEQSHLLARKLEYHLLANHLFANGKALIFVGVYLKGQLGSRFLDLGLKILKRQISEQFFRDGGHFERSPMYHNVLLWDLLDLIHLARQSKGLIPESYICQWQAVVEKGISWMDAMQHPDGEIAFFNDSALGIAPGSEKIKKYAGLLGIRASCLESHSDGFSLLKSSGFISVTRPFYKLIADVGEPSPRYQAGHSHAETLSFELSVMGKRVFVNSGISQYGNDYKRQLQRSTLSHNTLVPNSCNSSQVWGGFRLARASRVENLTVNEADSIIDCSIRGFWDLNRKGIIHSRQFRFYDKGLTISDKISRSDLSCVAIFKLHPEVVVEARKEGAVLLSVGDKAEVEMSTEGGEIHVIDSMWYPSFGHEVPTKTVLIQVTAKSLDTDIKINNAKYK